MLVRVSCTEEAGPQGPLRAKGTSRLSRGVFYFPPGVLFSATLPFSSQQYSPPLSNPILFSATPLCKRGVYERRCFKRGVAVLSPRCSVLFSSRSIFSGPPRMPLSLPPKSECDAGEGVGGLTERARDREKWRERERERERERAVRRAKNTSLAAMRL